jgi:hypothetical protein
MNNLFFLAAETTKTTKTFWEVFVNTDELVGLIINVFLLVLLGYVVFKWVTMSLNLGTYNKGVEEKIIRKVKELRDLGLNKKDLEEGLENFGSSELAQQSNGVNILATISGVAPMIGFLGTTLGMISVFIGLEADGLHIETISGGILTAMTTTVSGLVVGIFGYIGYNSLVIKIDSIANDMRKLAYSELLRAENYDTRDNNKDTNELNSK